MKGWINKYFADRGFGYLEAEGRQEGVFFHFRQVLQKQQSLIVEGLWAEFDIGSGQNGREQAINIRLLLDEDIS